MGRLFLLLLVLGCGRGDEDPPVYQACEEAEDCTEVPEDAEAVCLPKEGEGYCSWICEEDADCLFEADDAEDNPWNLVCASFEEEPDKYCFPACLEDEEAEEEEVEVCPPDFTCRSTGGGVNQRRVCFPLNNE